MSTFIKCPFLAKTSALKKCIAFLAAFIIEREIVSVQTNDRWQVLAAFPVAMK